jgi:hypothetical protein
MAAACDWWLGGGGRAAAHAGWALALVGWLAAAGWLRCCRISTRDSIAVACNESEFLTGSHSACSRPIRNISKISHS